VYVGHTNALKEDLTAMESLQFLLQLDDHAVDKVAALEAMRQFSIHQRCHQIVKTLSQGQRRRVALSRLALKKESALWVLDEPFEALDSQGMEVLYRLISEHTQRGGSVLLTSHIPVESSATPVRELHLTTLGSA
jgi:heme exporter protein A